MEKEKNYLIVGTGERLARLVPESPSSMQKDLAHGHASEIQGILFDMIALGDRLGVKCPPTGGWPGSSGGEEVSSRLKALL